MDIDLKSEADLIQFIQGTSYLNELLTRSEELQIPNWYFGAGCISQSYWNYRSNLTRNLNIKDIDWIYYDPSDLSEESEQNTQLKVRQHFKDLPFEIDVNNQARVHQWYRSIFGYDIEPYSSAESAIDTWPTTLTAIAITRRQGETKVYAPFGLNDFFSLTVRANKTQITEEIYFTKVNRWKKHWPQLNIVPWQS